MIPNADPSGSITALTVNLVSAAASKAFHWLIVRSSELKIAPIFKSSALFVQNVLGLACFESAVKYLGSTHLKYFSLQSATEPGSGNSVS